MKKKNQYVSPAMSVDIYEIECAPLCVSGELGDGGNFDNQGESDMDEDGSSSKWRYEW